MVDSGNASLLPSLPALTPEERSSKAASLEGLILLQNARRALPPEVSR